MILSFKKTRMAGAMALTFAMAATSLNAGGAVQMPGYGQAPVASFGIGLADLVEVNHKNNRWRGKKWCRKHPRR